MTHLHVYHLRFYFELQLLALAFHQHMLVFLMIFVPWYSKAQPISKLLPRVLSHDSRDSLTHGSRLLALSTTAGFSHL